MQKLFMSDEDPASSPIEHVTALVNYLFGAARTLHDSLGATVRIRIPTPAMVTTLMSPDASLEQKVAASRALLALVGQVLAVFMAITVVWRLLDAVAGAVSLVIWPLVVPMKLIWWCMSG
jgi:hypothetical protein